MTHPLITALHNVTQEEAMMNDERNERLEGYCDGVAGHWQPDRSLNYREAREDGAFDRAMLAMHAEMQRRAAL